MKCRVFGIRILFLRVLPSCLESEITKRLFIFPVSRAKPCHFERILRNRIYFFRTVGFASKVTTLIFFVVILKSC